jgi:hypothetical protein
MATNHHALFITRSLTETAEVRAQQVVGVGRNLLSK